MSQAELDQLALEERELQDKMNALRVRKTQLQEEERARVREIELAQPVIVKFMKRESATIIVENSKYREDVVGVFQRVDGRSYRNSQNLVPIAHIDELLTNLKELDNIHIAFPQELREDIDWFLSAPPWEVDLFHDRFIAKSGPKSASYSTLGGIPGANWDYDMKAWTVPLNEGWRIFEAFEKIEGVVYTDIARAIIIKQVEKRGKINEIAQKDDSEYLVSGLPIGSGSGSNQLRPFQRVGVEFMDCAGGRMLLGDDTGLGKTWQGLGWCELQRADKPLFMTLLVVKSANMANWRREVERLTETTILDCISGKPEPLVLQKIMNREQPYVMISYDTLGTYNDMSEAGDKSNKIYTWAELFAAVCLLSLICQLSFLRLLGVVEDEGGGNRIRPTSYWACLESHKCALTHPLSFFGDHPSLYPLSVLGT